jgi:diacylglycerol kinase family enzyme
VRRIAVMLNRNAQRVTPQLVSWMRAWLPADDLFVSGSLEEARAAAAAVVERGYGALCVGGGDGTLVQTARDLLALAPAARLPALLPLRLGGGNAIHDVCGSSAPTHDGLAADLARAASDETPGVLRLLEVDGQLAHFTGIGIDAKHTEDVRWLIKERLGRGPLAPLLRGVPGIVLAVLVRTLPRLLLEPRVAVRIVNAGAPALRFDASGAPAGDPLPTGATLHDGPVVIAAAATITQYSRGMTFFPFAERFDDRFHLRLSNAGAGEILFHLPGVFAGTYRNVATTWDFAVESIRVEAIHPIPLHIGGDPQPRTTAFTIKLSPHRIPVLRR